ILSILYILVKSEIRNPKSKASPSHRVLVLLSGADPGSVGSHQRPKEPMNLSSHGSQLEALLGLQWAPVAVTYRDAAPAGVARVESAGPSGCSYWKLAAEGKVFYTEAADHYN